MYIIKGTIIGYEDRAPTYSRGDSVTPIRSKATEYFSEAAAEAQKDWLRINKAFAHWEVVEV